ncbi:hypothetical protein ACJX0J_021204 [Zea mays]
MRKYIRIKIRVKVISWAYSCPEQHFHVTSLSVEDYKILYSNLMLHGHVKICYTSHLYIGDNCLHEKNIIPVGYTLGLSASHLCFIKHFQDISEQPDLPTPFCVVNIMLIIYLVFFVGAKGLGRRNWQQPRKRAVAMEARPSASASRQGGESIVEVAVFRI